VIIETPVPTLMDSFFFSKTLYLYRIEKKALLASAFVCFSYPGVERGIGVVTLMLS
jgi:hypothetical protein